MHTYVIFSITVRAGIRPALDGAVDCSLPDTHIIRLLYLTFTFPTLSFRNAALCCILSGFPSDFRGLANVEWISLDYRCMNSSLNFRL